MATAPPPPPPLEPVPPGSPGEPSNRWPWVALGLGVLVIVVAVAFFLVNRPRTVNVNVEGPPTLNPAALSGTASPGPPATLVPPTLPASATLAPTASPAPSPTVPPAPPTVIPAPTAPPAQPTQPAAAAVPPTAPPPTAVPPTPAPTARPSTPAPPAPTPFAGQVANAGGLGNTRVDLDAAFGAATGETPDHLVVYRKGNFEYHVGFVPDPGGRAAVLVGLSAPQPILQPLTLEQAMAEAHRLLPKDAQPPNAAPEASTPFVVERYTSQLLAQALPPDVFTANKGQPGQFLVVYVRDPAQPTTRVTRFIMGPGTDPNALVAQGR